MNLSQADLEWWFDALAQAIDAQNQPTAEVELLSLLALNLAERIGDRTQLRDALDQCVAALATGR